MSAALITGSAGLIGSETAKWFHEQGFDVVGKGNDLRAWFFGTQAQAPNWKYPYGLRDILKEIHAACGG